MSQLRYRISPGKKFPSTLCINLQKFSQICTSRINNWPFPSRLWFRPSLVFHLLPSFSAFFHPGGSLGKPADFLPIKLACVLWPFRGKNFLPLAIKIQNSAPTLQLWLASRCYGSATALLRPNMQQTPINTLICYDLNPFF